ncbi:SCO family protein [Undibacterium sp. Ji67W]|uniref:SCO family protein n=1 Tax=Undibacterium sp. Ji67W TaxID=3413042 RepID=UPI003BF3E567
MNSIRRNTLGMLSMLGIACLSLSACKRNTPVFNGIDITGAGYGGDFHLTGHDGKTYSLSQFKGKYVLLFFGYTQCPDICPTALTRALHIRQQLGADGKQLQVIFITVDPERDTQPLLAEYMHAFDPTFLGLYGTLEQTQEVAKAFRVFYKKVPSGSSYSMDHTAISYLYDTNNKIRLAFKHEQSAEQCAADIQTLIQTQSS